LAEIDKGGKYHRTYGQLAYAHRALGEHAKALTAFSKAIEIRNKHEVAGYRLYEFGRAACRAIETPEDANAIQQDLAEAVKAKGEALKRMQPLEEKYEVELKDWFEKHPGQVEDFREKNGFDPLGTELQ